MRRSTRTFFGAFFGILLGCLPLSLSAQEWPDLSTAATEEGGGDKDAAVIIGIEVYDKLPPIPGAVQNAEDWYTYLTKTKKLPVSSVKLLRDDEGTREKLLKYIEEKAGQVKSGGTFWLIFIGHGAPGTDKTGALLVGVDTRADADSLASRAVGQEEILALLKKGKQSKSVLLFDTCFSGKSTEGAPLVEGLQDLVLKKKTTEQVTKHKKEAKKEVVMLMAAASDQYAGPLPGAKRPAFSYLALGGLRGWADQDGDGEITAQEVATYTNEALLATVQGRSQTPELAATDTGAKLSKGKEKSPDLAALVLGQGGTKSATKSELTFGAGLSVTTPKISVSAVGTSLKEINIEAEKTFEKAQELEASTTSSPKEKAEAWCALAEIKSKNPYLEGAKKACKEWKTYQTKHEAWVNAMKTDYAALQGYWELKRPTKEQKQAALEEFLSVYQGLSAAPEYQAAQWAKEASLEKRDFTLSVESGLTLKAPKISFVGHTNEVTAGDLSPDGKLVLTGSSDKTARLWEAKTGAHLSSLSHEHGVSYVEFGSGSTRAVVAQYNPFPSLWDAKTGKLLLSFWMPKLSAIMTNHAKLSADGSRLVTSSTGYKVAYLWNTKSGDLVAELVHDYGVGKSHFSPDGAYLVTASTIPKVWDAKTGALLMSLSGHTSEVYIATFSPDGNQILTASADKTAKVWDAKTGALLVTLTGHTDSVQYAEFSPDGTRIATASWDKSAKIWDAKTGALLATLSGHTNRLMIAKFSPDGARIVTTSLDKSAKIWDAKAGSSLATLLGHTKSVHNAEFTPDGARVLTVGYDGAKLW